MTDWSTLKKLIWLRIIKGGGSAVRTVKGAIVHVTNALARPAISVKCDVEPIQDLHGYDSPWPAGGGVNLLPFEDILTEGWTNTQNGITATYSKGVFHITGTNTSDAWNNIVRFIDAWVPQLEFGSGNYAISDHLVIRMQIDGSSSYTNKNGTFAAETSVSVRGFYIAVSGGATVDWTVPMMFVKGTTVPTTYSPYSNICPISGRTSATIYHSGADTSNPTTYTIQLGETVYGGTLDVTGGKMVVDRAMLNLGTLIWALNAQGFMWSSGIRTTAKPPATSSQLANIICSNFQTVTAISIYNGENGIGLHSNGDIRVRYDNMSTDVSAFKTAMSGVQLCYELATPIEITLTPTQIDMLLGENNLWADAGDSTLTYYADGNASTSEALGILLGGTYNNPGGADDVSDDEALGILLGGS